MKEIEELNARYHMHWFVSKLNQSIKDMNNGMIGVVDMVDPATAKKIELHIASINQSYLELINACGKYPSLSDGDAKRRIHLLAESMFGEGFTNPHAKKDGSNYGRD